MTAADYTPPPAKTAVALWRERMGLAQTEAARRLGVALPTFQAWERGVTWSTGEPVLYQKRVLLAAAAIEHGIEARAEGREQPDLREWRLWLGLSHAEAAEALGVSKKRYQEWEEGFDYTLKKAITKLDHRTWLACAAVAAKVPEISVATQKPATTACVIADRSHDANDVLGQVLLHWGVPAGAPPQPVAAPRAAAPVPQPKAVTKVAKPAALPPARVSTASKMQSYRDRDDYDPWSIDEDVESLVDLPRF